MPFCSKCGVEVDGHVLQCPLCMTPIQQYGQDTEGEGAYPRVSMKKRWTNKQKRFIAWAIITIVLVTAFLVVLTVNLSTMGGITWASYPMTALGAAWLYFTLLLLFFKSLAIIIIGNFLATAGCLALLDLFNSSLDWFLILGLPVVGIVTLVTLLIVLMVKMMKELGANFIGFILIILGIMCIGLDLLISAYIADAGLSWSFVVMAVLYPVALFLMIYHYKFRKTGFFEKLFHM